MARLSLLPLEIESGRWAWVQRYDRLCRLEFDAVEGLAHFLTECSALIPERVGLVNRYEAAAAIDNPLRLWRDTARKLECW